MNVLNVPTRYWQPTRLRQRGRRWIMLKRVGLASLLLGGSSLTARHTRADDIQWTLGADGSWDVATNWSSNQISTSSDDATNLSGFLISLANTGFANTFTTNSNFNLTGTLNLTSKLTQSGSSVFTINGGHLGFTGGSGQIMSGNILLSGGSINSIQGATLTLDSSTFVHGGSNGFVGAYTNTYGGNLINYGTISADMSGQALYVQPGYNSNTGVYSALTSTGMLQAINNGQLYVNAYGSTSGNVSTLGGNVKADGSGSTVILYGTGIFNDAATITASNSGLVELGGDYDNQGHTITIADGSLSMAGGTLRNSTVNLSGTGVGLDFSHGNGTLDTVTVNGAINVAGNSAFIYNNLTATNGITVAGGRLQFQTNSLLQSGNVSLTKHSRLVFS